MNPILAQLIAGYSILQIIITVIIVIAAIGILYIVAQAAEVTIPPWVIRIGWILLVAFVAIFAIKLLMSMA
jgi:hypothetical protein